jgi:hypothetical protein
MNKSNLKYAIVLGCPRSGTTFLMGALNALSNSECISGDHLPVSIPSIVNQKLPKDIVSSLAFGFKHSLDNYLDRETNSKFNVLHKWTLGCIDSKELIASFLNKRYVKNIIYKEPFLAFSPEFAYNALPGCKIIHIYRDGRDCADSLMRKYNVLTDEKLNSLSTAESHLGRKYWDNYIPWWVEKSKEKKFLSCTPYLRAVWMWKEMVKRCHELFSKKEILSGNRVLLLKYEDLVSEPVKYGKIVVKHLGRKWNKRLEIKFKKGYTISIGIHKRRNPKEIRKANEIAKQELKIYGYI